jgi:ribosomal protein S3
MLLKTKKHVKNISIFIKKIYKLYFNKIINFKGYKIAICGKLNGKMKRQKYKFKIGKIMLNSFNCRIDYFYLPLYTKYGVFSIKI